MNQVAMSGELESESEQAPPPRPKSTGSIDWVADVVLTFGFICCAGVAAGWIEPPFSPGASSAGRILTHETAASGGEDLRYGTWASAFAGNSKWMRTAKVSSASVHAVRISLSLDFIAAGDVTVPAVLGEYAANALLQQDGKGQASENGCQVQVEWAENDTALILKQKGPCGEAGNLAADGMFSGTYRKQQIPAAASPGAAGVADCAKLRSTEEKLFCKDPALRVAREVTAAVLADASAVLNSMSPTAMAEFEQADKQWQAEIRKVCLVAEGSPEDPDAGKSACFSQSYDARMNWLRLHTGLLQLSSFAAKDPAVAERYSEALSSYADTYGALTLQLPMFAARLHSILPAKDADALEAALTHRGPRGGLFQSGCGSMGCDLQEGAFEINAETSGVTAALRQGGKITVYSLEGQAAELPENLREWLEQRTGRVHEIIYKP